MVAWFDLYPLDCLAHFLPPLANEAFRVRLKQFGGSMQPGDMPTLLLWFVQDGLFVVWGKRRGGAGVGLCSGVGGIL